MMTDRFQKSIDSLALNGKAERTQKAYPWMTPLLVAILALSGSVTLVLSSPPD